MKIFNKSTFAFLTLLSIGMAIHLVARNTSRHSAQTKAAVSPIPCPTAEVPDLIDGKYITKFNGKKLPLKFDYFPTPADELSLIASAKVEPLADGGLLVNDSYGLRRIDKYRQTVWTYDRGMIFDFSYIELTSLIYGTAQDNTMFILDAATGNQVFIEGRNGSAAYGRTTKYREDMCLITDNFAIYRERGRSAGIEPMKDGITCWRGTKALWHQDFPPDAELVVSNNRILAVTRSTKGIYVQEITPPAGL